MPTSSGPYVKILKTTKLYFNLGSNSDLEMKTLNIISQHYLSSYTQPVPLSINTWLTSSSLSLWISFYLHIMVIAMFHIFLVFKSCPCNVLASFDINFVSSLHILFLKFPSLVFIPLALLLFWNWGNRRAGQHSTHAEARVLFQLSISDSDSANIGILQSLV